MKTMLSYFSAPIVFAILLCAPLAASADVVSDLQAQVAALTQMLGQLQAKNSAGDTIGAVPVSSSPSCSAISATLTPGSSGSAVTQLQMFLASVGVFSVAPTGYYGPITTAAVQAFQAKSSIVNSGSPSTTGYGAVGPKTLAAIEAQCGGVGAQVGAFMQVSPTSGKTPLYVSVQATVNTLNSCVPATYMLDWGDQSPSVFIPLAGGVCQALQQTYTHTYASPAAYVITLSAGTHSSQATVVAQP